jgi:hypothetical protein
MFLKYFCFVALIFSSLSIQDKVFLLEFLSQKMDTRSVLKVRIEALRLGKKKSYVLKNKT